MQARKRSLNKCRSKLTEAAVFFLRLRHFQAPVWHASPHAPQSKLWNYAPTCSRSMISSMREASVA